MVLLRTVNQPFHSPASSEVRSLLRASHRGSVFSPDGSDSAPGTEVSSVSISSMRSSISSES